MATTWTLRLIVAVSLALSGCTMFRVEGPLMSGVTTIQPPAVCPSPVPKTGITASASVPPS
jgi:hypothetical protein